MQRFGALVGQLSGDDDFGAVEVVGEQVPSDVLDRVLGVVDSDVRQQRGSDLIVEPSGEPSLSY